MGFLDSFSPFWITFDEKYLVKNVSEFFRKYEWEKLSLQSICSFVQPKIIIEKENASALVDRILIIQFKNLPYEMRGTYHSNELGEFLLLWPILESFNQIREYGLAKEFNHPNCQLSDILILKDVMMKSQEKVKKVENQNLMLQLEKQKAINVHQAKLASLGVIAAGLGHEINNPMSIAAGFLKILKQNIQKDIPSEKSGKYSDHLSHIEEAHLRVLEIVKNLKQYSRAGDQGINEIIDPLICVENTYALVSGIYEKEGIKLDFERLPDTQVRVKGNGGFVQQALMNFLSNARDAIEKQNQKVIRIKAYQNGPNFEVSVTDNGPGIPDKVAGHIFDPFFTTKEPGRGTGLGLGISLELIKSMGGNILFENTNAGGASFILSLPVIPI